MAKTKIEGNVKVSALGSINSIKKENEKKEKAYQKSVAHEENVEQINEEYIPEPIPVQQQVLYEEPQRQTRSIRQQPVKKQMGDLFDAHSGDKEGVSIRLDKATVKEIDKICKNFGISRTAVITKAIEVFLDTYEH